MDIEQELRQKIHGIKSEIYLKTQDLVHKCWAFESEIKRPYFHIKPIDEAQLANWRKYLDFQESAVDSGTADISSLYVLYERCMVACALYEEFWLRYARCLIARGDYDGAKNAYYRAATQFLVNGRTELRLEFAAFEEEQGRVTEAAEIYTKQMENVPGHIETLFKYVQFVRRNFGVEQAEEFLTSVTATFEDEKTRAFLISVKAKLVYQHRGSIEDARAIYTEFVSNFPDSKYLLLQYFLFELNLPATSNSVENAQAVWDTVKSSPAFTEYDKLTLGQRYSDFLLEHDSGLVFYNNLVRELNSAYKMPTLAALAEADGAGNILGKKRTATEEGGVFKIAKTIAGSTPAASTVTTQQSAYGGTWNGFSQGGTGYGQQGTW
ncbi:hypothetical protein HK100_000326 [Physocladia obscura]|uniref:Uncharacterized protein n=1 Tax=Physocladia obscura TaxID=109957 RepID=A0AAD5SYI2_9FUNG|nr:hypothetical protein HK100_000326 [Physocladia obscura]